MLAVAALASAACSSPGEIVSPPTEPVIPTAAIEPDATPTVAPAAEATLTPTSEPTATATPVADPTATPTAIPVPTTIDEGFSPVPDLPVPDDIAAKFSPPNLPPLLFDGPLDWPERGMDQIDDPLIREAIWNSINFENAALAVARDGGEVAEWTTLKPSARETQVNAISDAIALHASGRILLSTSDTLKGVRVRGLNNEFSNQLNIEYCQHVDWIEQPADGSEQRPIQGSRIWGIIYVLDDGRWQYNGNATPWVLEGEFEECPGFS